MTITRFEEVSLKGQKRAKCSKCEKKLTRSRKFLQTLSPFNKAADGLSKTRDQIHGELREEIAAWKEEPVVCAACSEAT
jgi:hypothetical protein